MAEQRPWFERALSFTERRRLKSLQERALRIADLEPQMEALSDEELRATTAQYMQRFQDGESLDDLLPEAFATCREASKRFMGMRHFDVQLLGGIALHEGSVAEMLTGEGKTLVATAPLYLNALSGKNVHLITTNDYLAKRDSEWMAPLFEGLGMTVGHLYNMQPPEEKRAAYACNITYGTNSEFGFDYLRDNMSFAAEDIYQRDHFFAIVDEADSILIDEARTPLIISGQPEEAAETYFQFAKLAMKLEPDTHYEFDEKMQTAHPTEEGVTLAERELGIDNLYLAENNQLVNHLNQAIRAKSLYHRDKEYVVMDGEVKIVDEHTGRVMEGRRWSEGLHQAIEAKEGVKPQQENVTVASITIQNYFRLYDKLAGMTGTASTEAPELKEIYNLDVVEVPPNRPVQRLDENDFIFRTETGKFAAVVNEIKERHEKGQPVLVGTVAVEKSEYLSDLLTRQGVPHTVLNAKQHEKEAQIVLDAGQQGAVTIATNMAGRGIDIKLGEGVLELGGLFVLGTERHESRRIDNQLRGRSGRQGDPGETRFFISAQDDLVRIFAGDRMERVLGRFMKDEEDVPISASMLTKQIMGAQKRVEERNFHMRKNVLKYDDVLNTQRGVIYELRRRVLDGHDLRADTLEWLDEEIESIVALSTPSEYPEEWEYDELIIALKALYPTEPTAEYWRAKNKLTRDEMSLELAEEAQAYYEKREGEITPETMREVERILLLQILDTRWREHLDNMDYLRDGIGLRGLAQKDPLSEYRSEGYLMFQDLQAGVKSEFVSAILHVEVEPGTVPETPRRPRRSQSQSDNSAEIEAASSVNAGVSTGGGSSLAGGGGGRTASSARRSTTGNASSLSYSFGGASAPGAIEEAKVASGEAAPAPVAVQQRVVDDKVGRNEPCPCGSGKKYKNCHGAA